MSNFLSLLACCLALFLVCGCGDDAAEKKENTENVPEAGRTVSPEIGARNGDLAGFSETPKMAQIDEKKADAILAFHNRAIDSFTRGYHSLPQTLARNVKGYLETWKLPRKVSVPPKVSLAAIPAGAFTADEEKLLQGNMQSLDKAFQSMLGNYRKLEAYVADSRIRDDGVQGKDLADKIFAGHDVYMTARKSWLEIVEKRAAEAESALLEKHPLKRQVLAANDIFKIMADVSEMIAADSADRQMLASLRQSLEQTISVGEKPPFPASPGLERRYRGFLRTCRQYAKILEKCVDEGVFAPQKKELAQAALACHKAYNSFAETANSIRPR